MRFTRPGAVARIIASRTAELEGQPLSAAPHRAQLFAPLIQRVDDRLQAVPLLGELVLDPERDLRVDGARQETETLELAQPRGEHLGAGARQKALELAEALGTSGEVVEDQERPLRADYGQRPFHGAL